MEELEEVVQFETEYKGKNIDDMQNVLQPIEIDRKSESKILSSSQHRGDFNLNNETSSTKLFKIREIHSYGLNSETKNPDIVSSVILSKYSNVNQPPNSATNMLYVEEKYNWVIVKFHIAINVIVASAFKSTATVAYVKECLADVLELDEKLFSLNLDNKEVDQQLTLDDVGSKYLEKISFEVKSSIGQSGKDNILKKVDENIPTLTVITVHIKENGSYRDIVVEIEDQCCQKQWLGGYHNKVTNIDYCHALAQTLPKPQIAVNYTKSGKEYLLFHRDTQTPFKPKSIMLDTVNNKATQMCRSDLYISSKHDKIILAKPYLDCAESHEKSYKEQSAIIIQRAVRNWKFGKQFKEAIRLQRELIDNMKRQKAQIFKEQADKEREIITGAAYPVKRDDFYMLYLMVGSWWKKEWKRICDMRSKETKQAEVVALLQKHVTLLQEIEKHRAIGKKEALKKERMRFLNLAARPITFKNSRGLMTSIDDIKTQTAREFKEIYCALIKKDIPPKDRIDVLLVLKNLISNHFMDYEYAKDLVGLIDREINLLTNGFKMVDLKGLHLRIEQLYMNFFEQNEFNPKAALYKKPNLPKTFHIQYQCFRCKNLLPVSKFPVHVRMKKYNEGGCKSCTWLHNIGHQRMDMSPYLKLLKQVQNSEMENCCYSAVCFILQPIGMGFLTMKIWHGHSAISECRDISKLQHVRWLPDIEWAPWNTILLTDQEAKCHVSIPNVFNFYDQSFINSVQQKHILARSSLMPLLIMDHDIRSSGVWDSIKDEGVFLHPSHAEEFAAINEYDKV